MRLIIESNSKLNYKQCIKMENYKSNTNDIKLEILAHTTSIYQLISANNNPTQILIFLNTCKYQMINHKYYLHEAKCKPE